MRRPRLLIVGCGDVGMRVVRLLRRRWRVLALTTDPARLGELRAAGAVPLVGDLDRPQTLARLAAGRRGAAPGAAARRRSAVGPAHRAPAEALARHGVCAASSTGARAASTATRAGDELDETRAVAPATERAQRRVDAERRVRWFGRRVARGHAAAHPGIYALDRRAATRASRLLRHAGAARRGRRSHQPRPRRRPGARFLRRRAVARSDAVRDQRPTTPNRRWRLLRLAARLSAWRRRRA